MPKRAKKSKPRHAFAKLHVPKDRRVVGFQDWEPAQREPKVVGEILDRRGMVKR